MTTFLRIGSTGFKSAGRVTGVAALLVQGKLITPSKGSINIMENLALGSPGWSRIYILMAPPVLIDYFDDSTKISRFISRVPVIKQYVSKRKKK